MTIVTLKQPEVIHNIYLKSGEVLFVVAGSFSVTELGTYQFYSETPAQMLASFTKGVQVMAVFEISRNLVLWIAREGVLARVAK